MTQTVSGAGPKRIALFSGNYNYVMDGPVRALNRLVGYLEEAKGVEYRIYAPTSKKNYLPHKGNLVSVPSLAVPGRSEYRIGLGLPKNLRDDLDNFNPDIVHLSAPDWIGHAALKHARRRGLPVLASFHTRFDTYARYYGGAALEASMTKLMIRFYDQCDMVMPPAQSTVDALREQGYSCPLKVWSRGVDRDLFHPSRRDMAWRRELGFADDDKVLLFVGRLVLEKGIDFFCDVADQLRSQGNKFRVLVVGDGPARDHFQKRQPNAVFLGFQGGEELARAYASSDIFFNPSISEAFGNVTLEAMACGRPCVCAAAAGSNSLVAHGESGYLLPYGEVATFTDAIAGLLADPQKCEQFGTLGRERSAMHDWETILLKVWDEYVALHQNQMNAVNQPDRAHG